MAPTPAPPDTLNEVGVLKRREIEARILIPVLEALGQEFALDLALSERKRRDLSAKSHVT